MIAAIAAMVAEPAWAQVNRKPAIAWRCSGERCVGATAAAQEDLLRQCRRAVRVVGPVNHYSRGERALSAGELRDCNRFVIATQPPRN